MLSGEITESVSRCNHSVQLRIRELLKDAKVGGFGESMETFPQFGKIILFSLSKNRSAGGGYQF